MANNYSAAYELLRGINQAVLQGNSNADIAKLAEKTSKKFSDSSGITVALNDFTENFKVFGNEQHSNITLDDTKSKISFAKLFKPKNMFETRSGKNIVKDYQKVFQSDIFESEVSLNGGIKYAKEDDDLIQSAINFAKADIFAIEKPNSKANGKEIDGMLDYEDISSLKGYNNNWYTKINAIDLDGDTKTVTPEEYASYLLAADGYFKYDEAGIIIRNIENADGIITSEEAEQISEISDSQLMQLANLIYDFAVTKTRELADN